MKALGRFFNKKKYTSSLSKTVEHSKYFSVSNIKADLCSTLLLVVKIDKNGEARKCKKKCYWCLVF